MRLTWGSQLWSILKKNGVSFRLGAYYNKLDVNAPYYSFPVLLNLVFGKLMADSSRLLGLGSKQRDELFHANTCSFDDSA
jgi:hypothetical protein